jgi:hypothetical protein
LGKKVASVLLTQGQLKCIKYNMNYKDTIPTNKNSDPCSCSCCGGMTITLERVHCHSNLKDSNIWVVKNAIRRHFFCFCCIDFLSYRSLTVLWVLFNWRIRKKNVKMPQCYTILHGIYCLQVLCHFMFHLILYKAVHNLFCSTLNQVKFNGCVEVHWILIWMSPYLHMF